MTNPLLEQVKAAAAAAALKDQTKEPESGGGFEIPEAGRCFMRFVSYIEIGKRPQKPFQGKPKPDAHEVRLGFELVGKKHAREIEVDGEKKTVYPMQFIKVAVKAGDRAAFTKLLNKMTYGRAGITHMALMLGEGFIGTIVHNEGTDKAGNKKMYANMKDKDGNWLIGAPMVLEDPNDPECSTFKPVAVPAATQSEQLLLWDSPTKEQWDSIFIDGTREVKDEQGKTTTVSKNWIQEDIVNKARDFEGSALNALLLELAGGLELDGGKAAAQAVQEQGDDLADPDLAAPAETPASAPETKPAAKAEAPADDPLAQMGFDDL
jgi:hypothetical protein